MEMVPEVDGSTKDVPVPAQASDSTFQYHSTVPLVKLELKNITYSVQTKPPSTSSSSWWPSPFALKSTPQCRFTVLRNVSTNIEPYRLSAWMGPSGAGKTSLLTVAANLIGPDKAEALSPESTILVNGEYGELPKRLVGVVWQDDLLLSNLTVRENVWYAARLKNPKSMSDLEVEQLVKETLDDLGLAKVQESLVGGMNRRGISGGERKRTAVAGELVIRPSLLFLDEPTSGLDATTAMNLMFTLKTLARSQGLSIVAVIHQPRTTIFNQYIDSLLLLSRARVVYSGHPSNARSYLENSCGGIVTPLPPETGIADWIMDVIKEDEQRQNEKAKLQQLQKQQPQQQSAYLEDEDEGPSCLADYWDKHLKELSGSDSVYAKPAAKTSRWRSSIHSLRSSVHIGRGRDDAVGDNARWNMRSSIAGLGRRSVPHSSDAVFQKIDAPVVVVPEDDDDFEGVATVLTTEGVNHEAVLTEGVNRGAARVRTPVTVSMKTLEELRALPKFQLDFWTQFKLLTMRTIKQQRGERLTATAAVMQSINFFFTALFWWRLPDSSRYVFERNSLIFFMIVAQSNAVVASAVTVFTTERILLRRERSKKMYGVASYFLAKTISDMTNNVLLPLIYVMACYWTAGLRPSAVAYAKYVFAFYMTMSTAQSMGLTLSVAIPNFRTAVMLAPSITLYFIILGGFYIPFDNMNVAVEWMSWLSFCRYGYSALIINEYAGREVPCGDDLDTALATGGADLTCPLAGEDVIASLGIQGIAEDFWFNMGMVALFQIFFRFGSYWLLRRSN